MYWELFQCDAHLRSFIQARNWLNEIRLRRAPRLQGFKKLSLRYKLHLRPSKIPNSSLKKIRSSWYQALPLMYPRSTQGLFRIKISAVLSRLRSHVHKIRINSINPRPMSIHKQNINPQLPLMQKLAQAGALVPTMVSTNIDTA